MHGGQGAALSAKWWAYWLLCEELEVSGTKVAEQGRATGSLLSHFLCGFQTNK